jgi:hypothetical protein
MGAFEIALQVLGVRGWSFALTMILGVILRTRYRWKGRFVEEDRTRSQARA